MFNDLEMEGGPWYLPPSPSVKWKERFQARSKIPGILIAYAKQAPEVELALTIIPCSYPLFEPHYVPASRLPFYNLLQQGT